jgi:DNA-binding response OmpR family regulator
LQLRGGESYKKPQSCTEEFYVGELRALLECLEEEHPVRTLILHGLDNEYPTESVSIGKFRLDVQRKEVFYGNRELHLTPTGFEIFALLLRNKGKVFSWKEIKNYLNKPHWGDQDVRKHIYLLRNRLNSYEINKDVIKNIRGFGYRFEESKNL